MNKFAHRGISSRCPENTMTAFFRAYENNCYGIELDVQLTRDGEVVIIHDENLKRTTGLDALVKDTSFADIEKLKANKSMPSTENEHIPSLKEYCKWARDKDFITNIELKTGCIYYPSLVEKTIEIIKEYNMEDRLIYSSFNPLSLVQVKAVNKSYRCGLLVENHIVNAGHLCKDLGFEYYHPGIKNISKDCVDECHAHGIEVNVWTVNTKEEESLLINLGVDAAFCNDL